MIARILRIAVPVLLLIRAVGFAAEIRVEGDPPLPVPNLAQDPGMEEGATGQPAHWRFNTATPENFEQGWVDGGRSGKCLWMKAKTGKMSGYWGQGVPVEPGKAYLFKGYFRLAGGKMLCYANSSMRLPDGRSVAVDERYYRGSLRGHWLAPVFLPPEALAGPDPQQWYPFQIKAAIPPPMKAIGLSLGIYFTPGEAWFDDIWVGLAETDLRVSVKAGPDEKLERVTVRKADEAKPVFDSGALRGAPTFETSVKAQPTDAEYEVEAALSDGKILKQRYPAAAEKAK